MANGGKKPKKVYWPLNCRASKKRGTKAVQGVQVQQVQGTELYWSYGWKYII